MFLIEHCHLQRGLGPTKLLSRVASVSPTVPLVVIPCAAEKTCCKVNHHVWFSTKVRPQSFNTQQFPKVFRHATLVTPPAGENTSTVCVHAKLFDILLCKHH